MATTIVIPSAADIGATSTEVQTAAAADGDYLPRIAQAVITLATAATADINALQAGTSIADATADAKGIVQLAGDLGGTGTAAATPRVGKINSASVPAGGALTTGNVLQVSGVAALSYGAVNLAGGSNYVSGVLPVANVAARAGIVHSVRGVVQSNVADLAAFTVATHDGLTFVEGDYVLLAKQTTPAQDGPYVVGVVATGTAPLTRAADWAAAMVLPANSMIVVAEGDAFKNSRWFTSVASAITVATTAPAFYPERVKGTTVAMTAGAVSVTNTWILSATTSVVMLTPKTPGGVAGVLSYGVLTAGAGSGAFDIASSNAADTSTVSYVIENLAMNVPECIECPGCGRTVKPLRRKAPKVSRADLENVNPTMDFGWFCPVEECKVRLDKAIAALEPKEVVDEESNVVGPTVIPELRLTELSTQVQPKKVVPIRPLTSVKESEDLFARIRREHREVMQEERELIVRLAEIAERRKTLDLLMTAMNVAQESIPTELAS